MDPDANWAEQLRLRESFTATLNAGGSVADVDFARLTELENALNDWVSRGGNEPKGWANLPGRLRARPPQDDDES